MDVTFTFLIDSTGVGSHTIPHLIEQSAEAIRRSAFAEPREPH